MISCVTFGCTNDIICAPASIDRAKPIELFQLKNEKCIKLHSLAAKSAAELNIFMP